MPLVASKEYALGPHRSPSDASLTPHIAAPNYDGTSQRAVLQHGAARCEFRMLWCKPRAVRRYILGLTDFLLSGGDGFTMLYAEARRAFIAVPQFVTLARVLQDQLNNTKLEEPTLDMIVAATLALDVAIPMSRIGLSGSIQRIFGTLPGAIDATGCCRSSCPMGAFSAAAIQLAGGLPRSGTAPTAVVIPCASFGQTLPPGEVTDHDLRQAVLGGRFEDSRGTPYLYAPPEDSVVVAVYLKGADLLDWFETPLAARAAALCFLAALLCTGWCCNVLYCAAACCWPPALQA